MANNIFPESGSVGIGTTTPTANIDIIGANGLKLHDAQSGASVTLTSFGTEQGALNIGTGGNLTVTDQHLQLEAGKSLSLRARTNRNISFFVGDSEVGRFMADGRFGVGIDRPPVMLSVGGTAFIDENLGIGTANTGRWRLRIQSGVNTHGLFVHGFTGTSGGVNIGGPHNVGAGNLAVAGRFGLGTTKPEAKAEIWDDDPTEATENYDGKGQLMLANAHTNAANKLASYLTFASHTDPGSGPELATRAAIKGGATGSFTDSAGHLAFFTAPANNTGKLKERLRIDEDGNTGIGLTTPNERLDVEGNMQIRGWDAIYKAQGKWNGKKYELIGFYNGWSHDDIYIAGYNHYAPLAGDVNLSYTKKVHFGWQKALTVDFKHGGRVGVNEDNPDEKLHVNGNVKIEGKIIMKDWEIEVPDYVFGKAYQLPALTDVETHIKTNRHLPGLPSEQQFKAEGLHLGRTMMQLLQKVEELTLYTISQQKQINRLIQQLNARRP